MNERSTHYPGEFAHFVFCGSRLEKAQEEIAIDFLKRFGGQWATNFSREVTHVIVDASQDVKCKWRIRAGRSLKYIYGILNGKWVLSYECMLFFQHFFNAGLVQSLRNNRKLAETDFEIGGDNTHSNFACLSARYSLEKGEPRLFNGISFILDRDNIENNNRFAGPDLVESVILHGGGHILDSQSLETLNQRVYRVGGMTFGDKKTPFHIPYTALLDCVSAYNLKPLEKFYSF